MRSKSRRKMASGRSSRAGACVVALLLLSAPSTPSSPLSAVDEAGPDPLALTPKMRDFVAQRIGRDQSRQARLLALREAIFDPEDGLGVTYGSTATHTAAGTFEEGTGNCLSFTLLFVALARELDLEARFVEVDEVTTWSQRGEVGLSHWHMYAEVELDNGVAQVDFLPWSDRSYRSKRRISDTRALAHYYNNLGAEVLTTGDAGAALDNFDQALRHDPTFNPAKVNRAVAHRRDGQIQLAATALEEVLAEEPANTVAAANLATLYLTEGRHSEASRWMARRDTFLEQNPFHHFRLGLRALEDGEPAAARGHFKQAIVRQRDEPVFFEQLATAYFRLGEAKKGRASLRQALRFTDDPERQELLRQRLAEGV